MRTAVQSIIITVFLLLTTATSQAQLSKIQNNAKEKVILDADMVEVFDDGMAMMMLAQSPNIDLIGVTIVVGNTRVPEGTAYAIKQLEEIKANIPVAMGVRLPLRPSRFETLSQERELYGIGHDNWIGAAARPEPDFWDKFYEEQYKSKPKMQPINQHSVDFIIEQVKKYPGEISIAAIGTCANLAMAVRKAPEIIPMIKRVVYMGGAFFRQGNVTPAAEFNWWMDPDAAKIAVRSEFKEQIVVGLDVCDKVKISSEQYKLLISTVRNKNISDMLKRSYMYDLFSKDPNYKHYIWDVITAAIIIDPSIIKEEKVCPIDVNTEFGSSYGQSLAFLGAAPKGTQKARIIMYVDEAKLWNMILETCKKM